MLDAGCDNGANMHQPSNHSQVRRRRSFRPWSALAIAATIAVTIGAAPLQLEPQDPTFRGRVDLVNVGVTVAGKKNRQLVTDLGFTQAAVTKFLASLPDAVDMTFIDFASKVKGARYAQSEFPLLVERVRALRADGETALYDAIGLYLDLASAQNGRKVMVLYTDGADTSSRLSLGKLLKMLKASDVTLYAIGSFGNQSLSLHFPQRAQLAIMAESTGGTAFFPTSVNELDRIYEQVLGEVRAQYTLGYVSTNEKSNGAWRKIDIKITRADAKSLRVRARKGYYGPSNP